MPSETKEATGRERLGVRSRVSIIGWPRIQAAHTSLTSPGTPGAMPWKKVLSLPSARRRAVLDQRKDRGLERQEVAFHCDPDLVQINTEVVVDEDIPRRWRSRLKAGLPRFDHVVPERSRLGGGRSREVAEVDEPQATGFRGQVAAAAAESGRDSSGRPSLWLKGSSFGAKARRAPAPKSR